MKRASKSLVENLCLIRKLKTSSSIRPFSSKTDFGTPIPKDKKALILEQFRLRQQKCTSNPNTQIKPTAAKTTTRLSSVENEKTKPATVVSGFVELGLKREIAGAMEEMGACSPSEIQCVGIPAVLDGKNVVLSSESGCDRSLAYLLPLVQLLRQDEASIGMRPNHPRAIVLCNTDEQCDECFGIAKFISDHARSNTPIKNSSNPPLGMLVGTPRDVCQQIKERDVVCNDIKYLVLDGADTMLEGGSYSGIQKIVSELKGLPESQTILVTSTVSEMLDKQQSTTMESLEQNHSGKVSAMLLELDQSEVFDIFESSDALRKKVAEAMDSLRVT